MLRAGGSLAFLFALLVLYGPFVILPTIWGLIQGIHRWRASGPDLITLAFILNLLILPFVPFSTYREPNGMFRFMAGMLLVLLLFLAQTRRIKALRYTLLYLVLNTFLLRL